MPTQQEDEVRRRAFAIWDNAGRPEGNERDHWLQAEAEIAAETKDIPQSSQPSAPVGMITCKRCSTANTDSSRFCISCGTPLGAQWETIAKIIDERLSNKVRSILKSEYGDQKALELETTELIADRALKWAKTFGFFIGIPVAVATAFIEFLGLKTWLV